MSELRDAYYSTLGSERVGYAIYLDTNGKEVAVSEVVEVGSKPVSKWPDLVLVGQVTRFVKSMSNARWSVPSMGNLKAYSETPVS